MRRRREKKTQQITHETTYYALPHVEGTKIKSYSECNDPLRSVE